jgi:hypothetical protein
VDRTRGDTRRSTLAADQLEQAAASRLHSRPTGGRDVDITTAPTPLGHSDPRLTLQLYARAHDRDRTGRRR